MKVIPAPGRAVRDPKNMQMLPPEGREVPDDDSFWVRRVRDGDVIVEAPPGDAARSAAPPPSRKEKETAS